MLVEGYFGGDGRLFFRGGRCFLEEEWQRELEKERARRGEKKNGEKLEAAEEEVFHGFLAEILRRLKLNRTLPEKGTLRYECSRYIVLFRILTIPLHFLLIFGYLLFCLRWIMKATCCLLRYNPEFIPAIVNLNMFCFYL